MNIQVAPKVKCIMGMIYSSDSDLDLCLFHLEKVFGSIDLKSNEYFFNVTDYYEDEMGKELKRKFVSFRKLIEAQQLSEIKRLSNIIEIEYSNQKKRSINLDPGYLDMDKFVLASAKYGRQKIYLDKGIYADPTLYFFKREFHAYSWSFPDFSSGIYNEYFIKVRQQYKAQIKDL
ncbi:MAG: DUF4416 family protein [Candidatus Marinimicrobia bacterium]|nr:DUF4416 family protein [Candidatus Neomarinimicrobiota bacterium]